MKSMYIWPGDEEKKSTLGIIKERLGFGVAALIVTTLLAEAIVILGSLAFFGWVLMHLTSVFVPLRFLD